MGDSDSDSDSDSETVRTIRETVAINRLNTSATASTLAEESDADKRKRQDSEGSEDLDEDLGSEGSAASPKHGQIAGTVDSYRVADLRDELRRRKQATTGSKPNLFRRLLGYITPSKIWPVQYNYPGAADQVPLVTIAEDDGSATDDETGSSEEEDAEQVELNLLDDAKRAARGIGRLRFERRFRSRI